MRRTSRYLTAGLCLLLVSLAASADATHPHLAPIDAAQWDRAHAAHLLERAGFGGTPAEIDRLTALGPQGAVRYLVYFEGAPAADLAPFEHSGIFDPGLDPFPPSRPATTKLAEETGEALGIKVKAGGNRPMQPIVNKFFYWLRASMLETDRVSQWWAERMLLSPRPLEQKMALFWHGHFATNEEKVRDYRKMLQQLQLFQASGLGDFRTLLIAVAQDPAMLAYLDAGVNVKGSPNENFAREIMELFTMGVGNYSEHDIREAARAFTGWNFVGTDFHVNQDEHDDGEKTFLGSTGRFDGVDIIDRILAHPATPEFLTRKIYRFFAEDNPDPELVAALGVELKAGGYQLRPFLETLFLSQAFYADSAMGTRIKSPVELVISTYRKLGLDNLPGAPDFNRVTGALGQRLMHPPTVAGWSYGRSWITPSQLIERGNFALNVVFPDIEFIPEDRYPVYPTGDEIRSVHRRLRAGHDMAYATRPVDAASDMGESMMAMSNQVDREEAFNTRYGSYRGWQMAIERVKPIERDLARLDLSHMVLTQELATPRAVVDYFITRFFSVPLPDDVRDALAGSFEENLGTADVLASGTNMEEPLRVLLHVMLSRPEYQLG